MLTSTSTSTLTLNFDLKPHLNPNLFEPTTTLIPIISTTMAPTEEEWAVIANKYRYGINADEAIKDELVEFIQLYIYKIQDLTDTNLWVVF